MPTGEQRSGNDDIMDTRLPKIDGLTRVLRSAPRGARPTACPAPEAAPGAGAYLQAAKRILDSGGNPTLRPARGAGTSQELDWLRDPPQWARGKWVALAGREAVASAETLPDLVERLDSMELPKEPLVHRVD
jgi:hypothetical protein